MISIIIVIVAQLVILNGQERKGQSLVLNARNNHKFLWGEKKSLYKERHIIWCLILSGFPLIFFFIFHNWVYFDGKMWFFETREVKEKTNIPKLTILIVKTDPQGLKTVCGMQ